MNANPEDPHFLTQTDEWNTLSPHEKRDRMLAEEAEERLALQRQQAVDSYLANPDQYDIPETAVVQTNFAMIDHLKDTEEKAKFYEDVLRAICSIKQVETRGNDWVAASMNMFKAMKQMQDIAKKALQNTGALK